MKSYTSSFLLILSLFLTSADPSTASTTSTEVSSTEITTDLTSFSASVSDVTSEVPTTTTVNTTPTPDISTTVETTATSESPNTPETTVTPNESTTGLSGVTSEDPATATVNTTPTPDISTTVEITATSESPNTAETTVTPDESTTGISGVTSGDSATTTVNTTPTPDISTTAEITATSESPNTAETTVTPDESTTGISSVTSEDHTMTTVDVTTTTSTQSTSKTTTAKPIECQNGGTPQSNNLACICRPGFTGTHCSNAETQITVKENIERTVKVGMEVNEEFTADHGDTSSEKYKSFVKKFNEKVVEPFYSKISNFERVDNIILSAGGSIKQSRQRGIRSLSLKETKKSLKVNHDVILNITNENIKETYENLVKKVDEVLKDIKVNVEDLVVNDALATPTDPEDDIKEVCLEATKDLGEVFQKYYEPFVVDGKVTCLTTCHSNHPKPKTCVNDGTCGVTEQGPSCYCLETEANWYLGKDCSFQVHKVGFYAGLGTVAAVAVITIAFLTAYLVINKQAVKRNKDIKQELVKEWLDDDFEWPPQKKTSVGMYDNPVYSSGGMHKQNSLEKYKPDFSADRYYTQNFSPEPDINLRNFQRDQLMNMNRPQIRTSFDI